MAKFPEGARPVPKEIMDEYFEHMRMVVIPNIIKYQKEQEKLRHRARLGLDWV